MGTQTSKRNPNLLSCRQRDEKFFLEIDLMDIVFKSLAKAFWLAYQKYMCDLSYYDNIIK